MTDVRELKTKNDIQLFIHSNLKPVENGVEKMYDGKLWVQKYGFRRGFQIHGVYVESDSERCLFHVDEYEWKDNTEPNFGVWNNFNEMLSGVAERYFKLWKLDVKSE